MLKIKNISSAQVHIVLPDIRLRREIRPGASMPFQDEEYEHLVFDPGFNALIDGHYIRVIGAPKIFDDDDEEVEVSTHTEKVYEAREIKDMLEKRDITAFAKFIQNATSAEKDAVIKYAVDLNVTDNSFAVLIKKYCGIDVIEAIGNYHQATAND